MRTTKKQSREGEPSVDDMRYDLAEAEALMPGITAAVQKYGGEFLARGGKCLTKEGPVQLRNVIIKFPDFDSAITFYESQEYSAALEFALANGVSTRNYTIVEGV